MHERAAVTAELHRLMAETGGNVSRVVAALGPGVEPDVVRAIWEEYVAEGPAADAELALTFAEAMLRCLGCTQDYRGGKLDACPRCGGDGLVIDTPPEFDVRSWVARA